VNKAKLVQFDVQKEEPVRTKDGFAVSQTLSLQASSQMRPTRAVRFRALTYLFSRVCLCR
jgi:hypothetical protein